MKEKSSFRRRALIGIAVYAVLFLILVLIINRTKLGSWLDSILLLFRPILIGLALAYLLNPFFRFFERKLLYRMHPMGLRRGIALLLTYLTLFAILALLVMLILPSLYDSMLRFLANYDNYVTTAVHQFNRVLENLDVFLANVGIQQNFIKYLDIENVRQTLSLAFLNYDKIMDSVSNWIGSGGSSVVSTLSSILSVAADILFALFISLYLLMTKEQRYAQIMRLRRALFSDRTNTYITRLCTIADRSFGGFLEGKVVDSLIIGLMTYVAVLIFRIPYPALVATIVGVTNILPFFGPIIGAIPTSVIVLLTEPQKVLTLLIIIVIIQQIDGNIIGPKILGNNTGVSSLCVLIAISTMGSLGGFMGMLLGVPLFATVLMLTEERLTRRLRSRGLSSATENYYPADSLIDPAADTESRSDRLVRRLEKRYLRILIKEKNREELTRRERIQKRIYRTGRKLHLLPALSDSVLVQFAVEEATREVAEGDA
ncbi:MAG TPA: hypothetical protein DDW30_08395 [Clostridiales bacterium]|nr:hypothetical protein [Clostridiales bacterium]